MVKILLLVLLADLGCAILCPGGKHECPKTIFSESTCCQVPDGSYGCCPLPNAVCCDDHIHCCSHGYVCNNGNCEKGNQDVLPVNQSLLLTEKIVCPDKEHVCPDNSTCCQLYVPGEYGCCPMPQAVCCSDGVHCCPQGSSCDLIHSRCVENEHENEILKSDGAIPFSAFVQEAEHVSDIVCPGGKYQCPDGSTCCQLSGGEWGCCPLAHAVCCPDHLHCCPQGMKCDNISSSCHQGSRNVTWFESKLALLVPESTFVICPGGTYRCPDNTTCCQSSSGEWGCCPYADAVCCSDHTHCCPNGYRCDVVHQQCIKASKDIPWLKKISSKPVF